LSLETLICVSWNARRPRTRRYFRPSGTATKDGRFVQASGVLAAVDPAVDAENIGLDWAHAWVDSHG
jgi:hypothetical protein